MDLPQLEDFKDAASAYWHQLDAADAEAATASTARVEGIVAEWRRAGVDNERLTALLTDPLSEVRYAASASLGRGSPSAVSTLRQLAEDPSGLIAPTAKLLLLQWSEVT